MCDRAWPSLGSSRGLGRLSWRIGSQIAAAGAAVAVVAGGKRTDTVAIGGKMHGCCKCQSSQSGEGLLGG